MNIFILCFRVVKLSWIFFFTEMVQQNKINTLKFEEVKQKFKSFYLRFYWDYSAEIKTLIILKTCNVERATS